MTASKTPFVINLNGNQLKYDQLPSWLKPFLKDENENNIPDLFEYALEGATKHIVINGQEYSSLDDVPEKFGNLKNLLEEMQNQSKGGMTSTLSVKKVPISHEVKKLGSFSFSKSSNASDMPVEINSEQELLKNLNSASRGFDLTSIGIVIFIILLFFGILALVVG